MDCDPPCYRWRPMSPCCAIKRSGECSRAHCGRGVRTATTRGACAKRVSWCCPDLREALLATRGAFGHPWFRAGRHAPGVREILSLLTQPELFLSAACTARRRQRGGNDISATFATVG